MYGFAMVRSAAVVGVTLTETEDWSQDEAAAEASTCSAPKLGSVSAETAGHCHRRHCDVRFVRTRSTWHGFRGSQVDR